MMVTSRVNTERRPGNAKHQRQLSFSTTIPPIVGAESAEVPSIAAAMLAYIARFRKGKDCTKRA